MKTKAVPLVFAVFAITAPMVNSGIITWTGAINGNWAVPGNWSPATVPAELDVAVIKGGDVTVPSSASVTGLNLEAGELRGPGTVTITGAFNWSGGNLRNSLVVNLLPQATGSISGPARKVILGATVNNQGSLAWTGAGELEIDIGAFNNSGMMELQNDATIEDRDGTGTVGSFNNKGTLDLHSGTLSIAGDYAPDPGSIHRVTFGGPMPATGFGTLAVAGTLTLAGGLEIARSDGFVPAKEASFSVITAGVRNGRFATVAGQVIGNDLYFHPTYPPNAVTLVVRDRPRLRVDSLGFVGGRFGFRLEGISGSRCRIDASTNLVEWLSVSTNEIPGSAILDFIDADSPAFHHRFYRAALLP